MAYNKKVSARENTEKLSGEERHIFSIISIFVSKNNSRRAALCDNRGHYFSFLEV
jgi:hypothetical protein